MPTYLDTSALAKWYLNESRSEDFSAWIRAQSDTHISRLTTLEFRFLLARRQRAREIAPELAQRIFAIFEQDVQAGHLITHEVENNHVSSAISLLERVAPIALRTLDAIHLSIAISIHAETVATADRIMETAARELGLQVQSFAE